MADVIRVGRGADCDIFLPDPRVPLFHSEIGLRDGSVYIAAATSSIDLTVNGVPAQTVSLQPGETIGVGPYDIVVVDKPPDKDLALTVELIRPLGDDLARLKARSRTELTTIGLGKRGWSWLLFAATILVSLGLPLLASTSTKKDGPTSAIPWVTTSDSLWSSGEISAPHRYFASDCGSCHQKPFVQVRDRACLSCHSTIASHADSQRFKTAAFAADKCSSCHKEHNGTAPIVLNDQAFCTSCHADLDRREPKTALGNASDFGADHPQFRPTVVFDPAGPAMRRMTIGASPAPKEYSNLKFSHAAHLAEKGVKHPIKGSVKLICANCHEPDAGGAGMAPIRMEENCIGCHNLSFDSAARRRQLPHGKPREAVEQMREFYAMMALRGGLKDARAPASVRRRRRPGRGVSPQESAASLRWAMTKAAEVASETIGKRVCGTCHNVIPPKVVGGGIWDVAPVHLADHWMPKSSFDHASHTQIGCVDCHAATQSKTANDVLLPEIGTCRKCHGGEKTSGKVPSTCISCHEFHQHSAPMRTVTRK